MKITAVTTTVLRYPHGKPIQDTTIHRPPPGVGGRAKLVVHAKTDEGIEGLGIGIASGGIRAIVEQNLGPVRNGEEFQD